MSGTTERSTRGWLVRATTETVWTVVASANVPRSEIERFIETGDRPRLGEIVYHEQDRPDALPRTVKAYRRVEEEEFASASDEPVACLFGNELKFRSPEGPMKV